MRVVIDGTIYDSLKTPILLVFDYDEREIFGMKRYVSAPLNSTVEERQTLIDMEIEEEIV